MAPLAPGAGTRVMAVLFWPWFASHSFPVLSPVASPLGSLPERWLVWQWWGLGEVAQRWPLFPLFTSMETDILAFPDVLDLRKGMCPSPCMLHTPSVGFGAASYNWAHQNLCSRSNVCSHKVGQMKTINDSYQFMWDQCLWMSFGTKLVNKKIGIVDLKMYCILTEEEGHWHWVRVCKNPQITTSMLPLLVIPLSESITVLENKHPNVIFTRRRIWT